MYLVYIYIFGVYIYMVYILYFSEKILKTIERAKDKTQIDKIKG